jgi:dipeptidase D
MNILSSLEPKLIWQYFEQITQVPRPSKKEGKILDFLKKFAAKHNLEIRQDAIQNIVICKPATPGMENRKKVVLQSHVDMVCEKNSDTVHDFENDPIKLKIENGWVKAIGTTLGGDDGIGMAAQLAVLAANDIPHGPIECLFTVDEETGLTGANEMEEGMISGEILLNLDSEEEGEFCIGCAGGIGTTATFTYPEEAVPANHTALRITVSGLKGGHSGDEIHKGLGNSNKILNRILWQATDLFKIRLSQFDGGNLHNAIAREAFAIVTVKEDKLSSLIELVLTLSREIKTELAVMESDLAINCHPVELPAFVISEQLQKSLLNAIYACPHGVFAMSQEIPGLVETSTNLASVKFKDNHKILVTTSQRSAAHSSKVDIAMMVESVFRLAGAEVEHSTGYPGWKPNTQSDILKVTREQYQKMFGKEPHVKAIHAGLECGLLLEKNPGMDMISFGPTINGAHSPDERMDIETVKKFWDFLLVVLANIPVK